jgi:hypothetical protein
MTDDRMALIELIEKAGTAHSLLRRPFPQSQQ